MHELSIAMNLLEAVQEEVEEKGYGAVEAVHLRVGGLSGVVPEALRSAYEMAAFETPLAASRLVIEEIPIVIHCATCGVDRPVVSQEWFYCSVCNTPVTEVVSGRELQISALEIRS
jgi:hydrogenase nickel incorporation protein HypA/HybF